MGWGGEVELNKKVLVIGISLILVAFIAGLLIAISNDDKKANLDDDYMEPVINEQGEIQAPDRVQNNEMDVSERKAEELFNFIPKVYAEDVAPFESAYMLDAVMDKIVSLDEEINLSVEYVDEYVKKIFGNDAKINKEEVSEPDVAKSLYYYSKEANTYAIIPVGYQGIYEYQIFKNATETDDAYYVYTYTLIGGYSFDQSSVVLDEFGDLNYENAKVQVIVGDKDGQDLVHVFDNYNDIYNEQVWLNKYSNLMPVYRYTLKKDGRNYYLTEVEQVNY